MMKRYIITIDNRGISDIRVMDDKYVVEQERYRELIEIEDRYKKHLNSLKDHSMINDDRLAYLIETEKEYVKLTRELGIDKFKPHYQSDPIKYAVHILKGYLRAYLKKHTTESTGIVEKRMLVVSFCHRIEEGLIDYLDELEEFNS